MSYAPKEIKQKKNIELPNGKKTICTTDLFGVWVFGGIDDEEESRWAEENPVVQIRPGEMGEKENKRETGPKFVRRNMLPKLKVIPPPQKININ